MQNCACCGERKRERESVDDQDPPSDHWPSSDSPPTHPVLFAPLTSSEAGRSMATKAICGLRQVGFGIDAASSERLRHRNGGKLDEGCNGDRGLRYLSLTTVSNKDCEGAKAPQKVLRHQNREKFGEGCIGGAQISVSHHSFPSMFIQMGE